MQDLGFFKNWAIPLIWMLLGVQVMKPTFVWDPCFQFLQSHKHKRSKKGENTSLYFRGLDPSNIGSGVT